MKGDRNIVFRNGQSPGRMKNLLQPLTVALVMVIFIILILFMGLMDLGRLDKSLVGIMENRGIDIVSTIENVAKENLSYLYQTLKEEQGDEDAFVPLSDKAFSPQESLVKNLVALAREIDLRWKQELLKEKDLIEIARRENLWLIAVLDEEGKILFKSREFLEDIAPSPAVGGDTLRDEVNINLFNRFGDLDEVGYIALRRKDGSGTIVIALDDKGLRYWSTKIAIRKAIDEVGWGQGLSFLLVMDGQGKVIGRAGDVPENVEVLDPVSLDVLTGKLPKASRKILFRDRRLLEIILPVSIEDGGMVAFARLGLDRERSDLILAENRNRMITSMIFIMVIGVLSTWALYRNQKRHAARVEEMETRLRQAERLSALGQLAAGLAHEIRNPLNAISMASQRIQREYAPGDEDRQKGFYRITGIVRDEIRRLNGIVEEFATFFKSRRLELSDHSIAFVIQKTLDLMEDEAKSRGIVIRTQMNDDNAMVAMDMDKMKQALFNLFKNAMESIPGEGVITVNIEPDGKDRVRIRISDTGTGLTAEELEKAFSPEFTTKEKGLGLGLPLAHEIIRGHQGEIRITSAVNTGTTVEILLPVQAA